jgi:hypothetical protein
MQEEDCSSEISVSSQEETEVAHPPTVAEPRNVHNESRAKHWCFTLNNHTPADIDRLKALEQNVQVDYAIFGEEVGENGTPHLQGFISFAACERFGSVLATVGQSHLTVTRRIGASIKYCKKDGKYYEFGIQPRGPGGRSDLDEFKESVQGGELSLRVLRDKFSSIYARFPR